MKKIIVIAATVLSLFAFTACEDGAPDTGAQKTGQKLTEQAFKQQQKAVPYPANELRDSLERRNLVEKLRRTNDPDKIGYVYLMSFGKVLGYYTIKGKVSSTQSQMTTSTLVERHGDAGGGNITYDAPGDDGSYGENEEGIFFFTTEGAYVTTSLEYIYSDAQIPFNVPELSK